MFSVPLICSSNGVATVSAMTLGLAPGNCALTTTVGGTTSGYSEIGSWKTETIPARKMMTEITPAKIGRSTKNLDKFIILPIVGVTGHRADRWRSALGSGRNGA